MNAHIVKTYDQELNELTGKIADIGQMSRLQLETLIEAFANRDMPNARRIIDRDAAIDHLEQDVNRLTVHLLAARQPLAGDLRAIVSALKIATDLERVADYVVSIARQLIAVNGTPVDESIKTAIIAMMTLVQDMLAAIAEAYAASNVDKALSVWVRDAEVDQRYAALLAQLRTCMLAGGQYVDACPALLFMARCLERMGDHIKNVAEDIYFTVTGELFGEAADQLAER